MFPAYHIQTRIPTDEISSAEHYINIMLAELKDSQTSSRGKLYEKLTLLKSQLVILNKRFTRYLQFSATQVSIKQAAKQSVVSALSDINVTKNQINKSSLLTWGCLSWCYQSKLQVKLQQHWTNTVEHLLQLETLLRQYGIAQQTTVIVSTKTSERACLIINAEL